MMSTVPWARVATKCRRQYHLTPTIVRLMYWNVRSGDTDMIFRKHAIAGPPRPSARCRGPGGALGPDGRGCPKAAGKLP